jgi:hypothetical protein
MANLNQILFDCLWGTCSSNIRRPRVAQCMRRLAQVTTLMMCVLHVPGSNFGQDADCHNRKLLRFCPFLPDVSSCRHDLIRFPSSPSFFTFNYSLSFSYSTSYVELRLNSQVFRGATLRRSPSGFLVRNQERFFCASVYLALWGNEFLLFIANICMFRLLYRSHRQAKPL